MDCSVIDSFLDSAFSLSVASMNFNQSRLQTDFSSIKVRAAIGPFSCGPDFSKIGPSESKVITNVGRKFYAIDWLQKQDGGAGGGDCSGNNHKAARAKMLKTPRLDFSAWRHDIKGSSPEIVGSSNGMLCISNRQKDYIVLWNPWIHKYFVLPSFPFESRERESRWHYISRVGAAFGYDHRGDDYKVVNCSIFGEPRSICEFCIYSLKTNSWRRIMVEDISLPLEVRKEGSHRSFKDFAVVNGVLHWIEESSIVAFYL
ncbi:OLC1v1035550C1 [Oldenlandia corymbosa var. corymbosa]|uniref:OLC1v1035550C1 n=1 Tax=Oldenlandia corymbosa var. corymbosa TaxID=529605 RepID=A0AAV1CTA9_OLDCO|nr:OLC1v1035550C1 [Oldenlandia corymbosa var. corymbosa]